MKLFLRIIWFCLLGLAVLVGCGRQEEAGDEVLPTAVPTAALPTPTPSPTAVPAIDETVIDWPPQLLFTSPAPNEPALVDGAITVRFDQPMDQDSVEEAFLVTELGDNAAVAGMFAWPRPDTVQFTPQNQLRRKQVYRVEIGETAVSSSGLSLPETIQFQLETVGFLNVGQVVPAPGANDVLVNSPITIFFNRPVVPLTTTDQQSNLPQPLQLTPRVEGEGVWLSTSIYQFTPDVPLAGATTYQAAVDTDLTDITGGTLNDPFSWQFTTIAPAVLETLPQDGAMQVRPEDSIVVTFNMPMNRDSVESAVSLSGGSVPPFAYEWTEEDTVFTMIPEEPLELGATYQLTVPQSAVAASGEIGLGETAAVSFQIVPLPAVLETRPASGTQADRFQRGFTVRFSAPMDLETLRDQIAISPEPEGRIDYFFNEFSNELIVDFSYEPSARYAVTVPRSAADPYGNTLGESYEFVFTTPPRPPIASFNLPPNIAQLSTSIVSRVEVIHVNISQASLALYDLGLPLGLVNRPFEVRDYNPATEPLRTWQIDVDSEENEAGLIGIQLSESGTLPTGLYLLTVASPQTNSEENRFWQNQRELIIVADSNLVVKEMVDSVHVWATSLRSGQPESGLALTLYNAQGVPLATAQTDTSGFATFPYEPVNNFLEGVTVVASQPGQLGFGIGNSQWNSGAAPWQMDIFTNPTLEPERFVYLYSDRPIYRPGDTVQFKGIVRRTGYGRYTLPEPRTLPINFRYGGFSPDGQQYSDVVDVELGADGTFSGEFVVPDAAPTGVYNLSIEEQDLFGNHSVTIAEYRRPEFIVGFSHEAPEALRGETIDLTLAAEYFFGGSAADLPVEWTVYLDSFRFQPSGPYYAFGNSAGFGIEPPSSPFVPFPNFGPLLSGSGRTDANGRFTITLPPDLLANVTEGSQTVRVEAIVSDISNFPVSAQSLVTLHAAEVYAGITFDDPIVRAGDEATVRIKTVDWDENAAPNQSVEVVFYERQWISSRERDVSGYFTLWETIDTEVARQTVTTNGQGEATTSFVPEFGGTYIAVATVTDDGGRSQLSSTTIWVSDNSQIGWQLDPREKKLDLVADQRVYEPGDTAQILVQSPFTEPVLAWLTIERGTLLEQRLITLDGSSDLLQIPIDAGYAPNVFVTIVAVKPFNQDSDDMPQADIRLGVIELVVDPGQFALNVAITPQADALSPRETAVFDIQVTNTSGAPVEADLSLALVDKAILTLKEDSARPILEAFYERQPYRSQIGAGLFISGENLTPEVPFEGGGFGGGGGGGIAAESAIALRDEDAAAEDEARSDFPDTAYWKANIQTDASGRASVSIDLPDTLTTWVLSSKAATENTLVGEASTELVTSLPLLLRPITPRFFTVGDEVQIGAVVNNNTDEELETVVSLEASGVTLQDTPEQTVTVPANGQALVRWTVTVPDVPFADLTFRAESGDLTDATRPSFGVGPDNQIPIYRFTARDVVATAGVMPDAGRLVEALWFPEAIDSAQGALTVELDTSLIGALLKTLEDIELNEVRLECATAVSDTLLTRIVAARIADQFNVDPPMPLSEIDLLIARLADLQKQDGGWGWCGTESSVPYFSAQTQFTLLQAQDAGFAVPKETLARGAAYLNLQSVIPEAELTSELANGQLFMLYVLSLTNPVDAGVLQTVYNRSFEQLLPESQALMMLMLHRQGALPDIQDALLASLEGSAALSATGAHWNSDRSFALFQSDVRNSAIVLYALSEIDSENALLIPAVRWLMAARQGPMWQSPHDTAWVTFALLNWATATGDTNADFEYRALVDLEELVTTSATPQTAVETETITVPLDELTAGTAHFVELERQPGPGNLYYAIYLDAALEAARVGALDRGMQITRTYYEAACEPGRDACEPIEKIAAGEQVRVELTIVVEDNMRYVIIDDPIPAGTEALDPNLDISATQFDPSVGPPVPYERGFWGYWYFTQISFQDERVSFSAEFLPAGTYQYTYFLQATLPGEYQVMPTFGYQVFTPEVNGRSSGMQFIVEE